MYVFLYIYIYIYMIQGCSPMMGDGSVTLASPLGWDPPLVLVWCFISSLLDWVYGVPFPSCGFVVWCPSCGRGVVPHPYGVVSCGVWCPSPYVDVMWCPPYVVRCGVPHTVGVVWSPPPLLRCGAMWCVVSRCPLWTWRLSCVGILRELSCCVLS